MQERYWRKLTDKRYRLIYISEYYNQCVWVQRLINVILAITSSGAIAAWAVWKEFPVVWAGVIAVSQVITAVKPLLPYEKRIVTIYDMINQLTGICNEIEAKWYYVANGSLSEEDINKFIVNERNILDKLDKFNYRSSKMKVFVLIGLIKNYRIEKCFIIDYITIMLRKKNMIMQLTYGINLI